MASAPAPITRMKFDDAMVRSAVLLQEVDREHAGLRRERAEERRQAHEEQPPPDRRSEDLVPMRRERAPLLRRREPLGSRAAAGAGATTARAGAARSRTAIARDVERLEDAAVEKIDASPEPSAVNIASQPNPKPRAPAGSSSVDHRPRESALDGQEEQRAELQRDERTDATARTPSPR